MLTLVATKKVPTPGLGNRFNDPAAIRKAQNESMAEWDERKY